MEYNPPQPTRWNRTGLFSSHYADAYNEGFLAAALGGREDDNPYKESGHERDTTFEDECHYYWYIGFNDYVT